MKSTKKSRRHKNSENKEEKQKPFFSKSKNAKSTENSTTAFFQPKLTIGQPGDKYEQEADSMADAVVNKSSKPADIQQKEISSIQRTSLATPLEYEKLGTAEGKMEEDKLIQESPDAASAQEEETAQLMSEEEEPELQEMDDPAKEEEMAQMQEEEEEVAAPKLQTKSDASANVASNQVTQKVNQKKGKGRKMPDNTQAEMETAFKKDFSVVNIHTDTDAIEMNRELGAKAFTTDKDIFFNAGKYSPESSSGKELLAHELTHVVQQGGDDIQKKPSDIPTIQRSLFSNIPGGLSKVKNEISKAVKVITDELKFQQLWAAFPKGSPEDVKKKIGGKVDADWITNTCAIRMSRVLNYTGNSVPFTKDETISGSDKKWYYYRIRNLRPFIESKYGAPDKTFQSPYDMNELKKLKGIILFDETNFTDATGHFTLWNGSICADKCWFDRAGKVHIWYP